MFPYQIYQALSDQRVRDLMAQARHHELAIARHSSMKRNQAPSRLRPAAQLWALVQVRRGAGASSTMTTPAAGPMGCSA